MNLHHAEGIGKPVANVLADGGLVLDGVEEVASN